MGVFAEMFGYTPDEYRGLSYADHQRLSKYIQEQQEAERRQKR